MKRNDDALKRIVSRFELQWRSQAEKAIDRLYQLLDKGLKVEPAINQLRKEFIGLFRLNGIENALVEATAYGYGIMPEVLTSADRKGIIAVVSQPWSADGMTLSEKLHGADMAIHKAIQTSVQEQINRNATVMEMARELYDGYDSGKSIISRPEQLPRYVQRIQHQLGSTREESRAIARAVKNIDKMAQNGAPNKELKTAYNELVEAIESGNDKAVQRAIRVALEEKARYIAERIARTESARAYSDGFFSKHQNDRDVVAYQFKLGTRHAVFDICDMYAQCDMFNLGKGVYPKNQVPLAPIHPHCMCRYKAIIDGKVDMDKKRDRQNIEIAKWANHLTEREAKSVLGVRGYEEFQKAKEETGARGIARAVRQNIRSYVPLQNPQYREISFDFGKESSNKVSQNEGVSGIIDKKYAQMVENRTIKGFTEDHTPGLPFSAEPNSIMDLKNLNKNLVLQRRVFDEDGNPKYDIDTTDHNLPKQHPNGAHKHYFAKNEDGKLERGGIDNLSNYDKINNADILGEQK